MARNQSLNHRNLDFRLQTSDFRPHFCVTVTVLQFLRNGAVGYYRMIFLPAATQPRKPESSSMTR